jgi:hypothetical protein
VEATGIGNDFLSGTQMAQQLRVRTDKWDYRKLKSFCTTKEMAYKLKTLHKEWEKTSYTSHKGLITKIYKEFNELNLPTKSVT